MRITVYTDDLVLMDTNVDSLKIIDPKLTQEDNKVGSFNFTIYPEHPHYNFIHKMKSIITVYEEGIAEPLFRGRVYEEKQGFYNEKQVHCEGELAFLNDSIQRPYEFSGTPAELFTQYINNHNSQVDAARQFTVGNITVTDSNEYIVRSNIDYTSTWKELNDKLIKLLGGHLWVRHENGVNYIDYLEDFGVLSNQPIEFGRNLLDISKNVKVDKFATALIPLGAKLKDEEGNDTDERLTIASVNEGIDYVYNADAIEQNGYIFTTQIWDDVTEASNLLRKGQAAIDDLAQFIASVEVSAADLNGATIEGEPVTVNSFRIGRYVKVTTQPHSLVNQNFLISKLTRQLLKPEATKLVLGTTYKSLTAFQNEVVAKDGKDGKNGKDGKDGADGKDAAIQSATQPTDTSYMWLDISIEPPELKRWDGEAWVIVNDQSTALQVLEQNFTAEITSSESRMSEKLTTEYYTKGDTDNIIAAQSAEWERTAQGFSMNFSTLEKEVSDVANNADARFNELNSYIRYEDGTIILGRSDNPIILTIENDRISFKQNNTEVAYISDNKLNITDGEFVNSLKIGKFSYIPRDNGNLSFKITG